VGIKMSLDGGRRYDYCFGVDVGVGRDVVA
jgi:hypothetical protein